MPKVIGYDESVRKRATCRKCGAINEYTLSEERVLFQQMMYTIKGFKCAQCGSEVITYAD